MIFSNKYKIQINRMNFITLFICNITLGSDKIKQKRIDDTKYRFMKQSLTLDVYQQILSIFIKLT